MHVEIVSALVDNYAYLVLDDAREHAIVVDPSEAQPVVDRLDALKLKLVAIWCTHHHPDHVGGVNELRARYGELPVLGGVYDLEQARIPFQTRALADGERFEAFGKTVKVHHVPGHTLGAIAYEIDDALFTGDTLFLGGCGRLFEGTPAMMNASFERLAALGPSLRVYPGHEYTEKNLEFALTVEPASAALQERVERVHIQRKNGFPSVPSTLAEEMATNPFMRVREDEVIARAREWGATSSDAVAVFTSIRLAKDRFR